MPGTSSIQAQVKSRAHEEEKGQGDKGGRQQSGSPCMKYICKYIKVIQCVLVCVYVCHETKPISYNYTCTREKLQHYQVPDHACPQGWWHYFNKSRIRMRCSKNSHVRCLEGYVGCCHLLHTSTEARTCNKTCQTVSCARCQMKTHFGRFRVL